MQGGEHISDGEETVSLIDGLIDAGLESRARARAGLKLSDSDFRALTFLVRSHDAGRRVLQRDLAEALSISTPSTTALTDRLTLQGWAERQPVATDRRMVAIVPTRAALDAVRQVTADIEARMRSVVGSYDDAELGSVREFLSRLTSAMRAT